MFTPQILGPTRITENEQASLIDNFFSDFHCTSGNFFEKISDHLPNFLIIEKLSYHLEKNKKPYYKRDYTNFDENNLIKYIGKLNLTENILKKNDVNKKYDAFHENLM